MSSNYGKAALSQLVNIMSQYENRKIKIVACVIRNDGTGWKQITGNHVPINIASVTNDNSAITINYSFTAKNVCSFICTPDESMASQKFFMGASVGLSLAIINIYQNYNIGGYVYYNGSIWTWSGDTGITAATFNSGILTITHSSITGVKASCSCRNGVYVMNIGTLGATTTEIYIRDYAGNLVTTVDTNMKIFFQRSSDAGYVNPNSYVDGAGNIWCLGAFEVN